MARPSPLKVPTGAYLQQNLPRILLSIPNGNHADKLAKKYAGHVARFFSPYDSQEKTYREIQEYAGRIQTLLEFAPEHYDTLNLFALALRAWVSNKYELAQDYCDQALATAQSRKRESKAA